VNRSNGWLDGGGREMLVCFLILIFDFGFVVWCFGVLVLVDGC
jgi:hypothetical protein